MCAPQYQVWGGWTDDAQYGAEPEFLESCSTFEEAERVAATYAKSGGRYTLIVEDHPSLIVSTVQ